MTLIVYHPCNEFQNLLYLIVLYMYLLFAHEFSKFNLLIHIPREYFSTFSSNLLRNKNERTRPDIPARGTPIIVTTQGEWTTNATRAETTTSENTIIQRTR